MRSAVERRLYRQGTLKWIFLSILLCVLGVLGGKPGTPNKRQLTERRTPLLAQTCQDFS